jgi:N-acyl homoserine lactone hydrolase
VSVLLWTLWRSRPGSIMVPGHDMPMTQENGRTTDLAKRESTLTAWFGDNLETVTSFALTV